jgi:hypothetical protein
MAEFASLNFLCAAQTLHWIAGYYSFSLPDATIFTICLLMYPDSMPGKSCLVPKVLIPSVKVEYRLKWTKLPYAFQRCMPSQTHGTVFCILHFDFGLRFYKQNMH